MAVIAFLITSLVIARLMSTVRKQAEEALSSVSHRVIEAEEQERHRMAAELHEDIRQRLTLLALGIEPLKQIPPILLSMRPVAWTQHGSKH